MSRTVGVPDRVVVNIRVAVEALGVGGVWYNGIGADETADRRIIPPRSHIYQLNVSVLLLPGVAAVGVGLGGRGAVAAEGEVAGAAAADHAPAIAITHDAVAA